MIENVKSNVISFLKTLPDDITIEDIMYYLYVRKKIQQGLDDIEKGRIYTHDEIKNLIKTWKK